MNKSESLLDTLQLLESRKKLGSFFRYLSYDLSDPRTVDWPLVGDPTMVGIIVLSYTYFVTSWGPKLMENRKPFKMQKLLVVYNLLHVMFSAYLSYDVSTVHCS